MPLEPETPAHGTLQDFGPIKRQLVHQSEDHEQGWQEVGETQGGGFVPEIRASREVPRTSMAQRFAERMRQAESSLPREA
jgi:hypothetical protein